MKPVTDILKTLIAQHGIEIIQQPRRLKAMLADLLPHEKRLRYLLDLSLQAEIPKRLIDIQYETSSVWDAKVSSIKHYFKEEYFLGIGSETIAHDFPWSLVLYNGIYS